MIQNGKGPRGYEGRGCFFVEGKVVGWVGLPSFPEQPTIFLPIAYALPPIFSCMPPHLLPRRLFFYCIICKIKLVDIVYYVVIHRCSLRCVRKTSKYL